MTFITNQHKYSPRGSPVLVGGVVVGPGSGVVGPVHGHVHECDRPQIKYLPGQHKRSQKVRTITQRWPVMSPRVAIRFMVMSAFLPPAIPNWAGGHLTEIKH